MFSTLASRGYIVLYGTKGFMFDVEIQGHQQELSFDIPSSITIINGEFFA